MHYIIYKTTNLLDQKYYIGCHQTDDLNDGYIGSGKYLKRAIKKYGTEHFSTEILFQVNSKEEMFALEKSIVSESLVNDPNSYNLKVGGSGGNPGIVGAFAGRKHTNDSIDRIRQKALNRTIISEETRRKLTENNAMKNDPAIRKKVSETLSGRTLSKDHAANISNANLGKILINNSLVYKRVYPIELPEYLNSGWVKGRKIKF